MANKKLLINVILIFVFASALLLRLLPIGNGGVNFDQIQIINAANRIIEGDFTLVGPRTGPADMFTGPFIYYFSVPFIYFFGDYLTLTILPSIIALSTGLTIFYLMKKYFNLKIALIALIIWGFSPLIIMLDKVFWNPNLMLLSCALLFIPLFNLKQEQTLLFLFCGALLSWQAHFAGLIMVMLSIIYCLWRRNSKLAIILVTGLFLSILPNIIFDFRHGWLNARGLIGLISGSGNFSVVNFAMELAANIRISLEMIGSIVVGNVNIFNSIVIGALILTLAFIYIPKKEKLYLILPIKWFFTIAFIFSLYSGSKPEYYFLPIFIPVIIILAKLLSLMPIKILVIVVFAFIINTIYANKQIWNESNDFSVNNIKVIEDYVSLYQPIKEIIYDTKYGSDYGIRYFLDKKLLDDWGAVVHIVFPNSLSWSGVKKIGGIGVWLDDRNDEYNYVMRDNYLIKIKKPYLLYENHGKSPDEMPYDEYIVFDGIEKRGVAKVEKWSGALDAKHNSYLDNCRPNCIKTKKGSEYWLYLDFLEASVSAQIF